MNPLILRRRSVRKYIPNKHRYWALRAVTLQTSGSVSFTVAEIEMRALAGGADQCTGGTPSASSTLAGTAASNGFDNNTGTVWSSTTADATKRISYDFGSAVNVNEVLLTSSSSVITQNAITLVVESSDNGTSWTTQWQYTTMGNWTLGEARTLTRPSYWDLQPYWRFYYTQNYIVGNRYASFAELSVNANFGDGVNLANASNIVADTTFDATATVTNLFDGNAGTWWASGNVPAGTGNPYPHWLTFTPASPMRVGGYYMTCRNATPTLMPAFITLQGSPDQKTWVDYKLSGYNSSFISNGAVLPFSMEPPFLYVAA